MYLHCLANVELKHHMKVLKNLFHNMALKNLYVTLYYYHILASVIRYVRTKQMVPNKCCGIFFVQWFSQVHQSINASKQNVVVFFHHNYDNQNLVSFFYTRISTIKQAFDFLQRSSYTNVCLKFLCDVKLITLLLLF